jgi:broad specificity phosphatase PhoE
MTAIFVLRHPQTTWNAEERYQGRLDAPLSRLGGEHACLIASSFGRGELDAVISSPLSRARSLAVALAKAGGAPLHLDQRLTEIALGAWEGLYRHEICARFPELYERWYTRPDEVRFPGGESVHEVRRRALGALADIFRLWPEGHVAVISHNVVIQVMVGAALALDLRHLHRIRVSNGGITTLCGTEAPGSVLTLNETAALYRSPAGSAAAENCVGWRSRRVTL